MKRITLTAVAVILAMAGCGHRSADETYVGSTNARVVIAAYVPEGKDEVVMEPFTTVVPPGGVGATGHGGTVINPGQTTMVINGTQAVRHAGDPPGVMLGVEGAGSAHYDLPRTCPADPILARQGRIVRMRVDMWRQPDGTTQKRLVPEEVVAALCGNFTGRDERTDRAHARDREKSKE